MSLIVTCLVAVITGAVITLMVLTIVGVRRDLRRRDDNNPEGK